MLLANVQKTVRGPPYPSGMSRASDSIQDVFVENVKRLMERRGWRQEQLGEKSGISQSHIGNLLRKQHAPSPKKIDRIAAAFGLPGWLLLVPDLPVDILDSKQLPELLAEYLQTVKKPLTTIVAQRAAARRPA